MHILQCLWLFVSYFNIASCSYTYSRGGQQLRRPPVKGAICHCFSLQTYMQSTSTTSSSDGHFYPRYGLETTRFQKTVQEYYISWLAPVPHKVYQTGQQYYLSFCHQTRLPVVPTTESTLFLFLAKDG